jgi:nitroimidazol reductase NimA-like FMN-containing flavoprotein (pyridoxamine 5'-phosphate oxidase superfamily)
MEQKFDQKRDRPEMPVGYGLAPVEAGGLLLWAWAEERLAGSRNYWICTTRTDGRPHAAPVWGVWLENALYFGTDSQSTKAKNVAVNPAVAAHLESGDEVVIIEGQAEPITLTPELVARLDEVYLAKYNMKLSEAGEVAAILRLTPHTVLAWLETDFPNTATRWRLAGVAK